MATSNGNGISLDIARESEWIVGAHLVDRERVDLRQWNASPQVFIGLGGTGTRAVTRIAERLKTMDFEGGDGSNVLPGCLQFMAFDTDTSEFTSNVINAGVRPTDLTVNAPEIAWDDNKSVFQALGFVEPVKVQGGAKAVRKWGRFAFVTHADKIQKQLQNALGDAQKDPRLARSDNPQIHVFFSLAGGTGCGIFLDLAFLLRELTRHNPGSEIIGYLVAPDNLVAPVPASVMASAASALKELEYFMQLQRGNPKFENWGEAPRFDDELDYRARGKVRGLIRRPFDYCYLFASRGNGQGAVESPSTFAGVLAEAAIRNAFTDAGLHHKKSVVNQDVESFFDRESQLKYASFSAIGYSRMMLPFRELRAYVVLSSAEILCDHLLRGARNSDGASRETPEQFVQRNLTTPLLWDEVVATGRRGIIKSGSTLEQYWKDNRRDIIKRACDGLKDAFDGISRESKADRESAITARLEVLEKEIDRRIDDLHGGLSALQEFFQLAQQKVASVRREAEQSEELLRKDLDKLTGDFPKLAQFLSNKGIIAKLNAANNFEALKTGYENIVSKLKICIEASANAELAARLQDRLDELTNQLKTARDAIETELKAYYLSRKKHFQSKLKKMRHGRVGDDCKTFCPVDIQKLSDQVDQSLEMRRKETSQLLARLRKTNSFDLKSLIKGGNVEEIRNRFVELLLSWVNLGDFWKEDDATRQGELEEWKRTVMSAGDPLLRFIANSELAVIGCYAGFTESDLNHSFIDPPDMGKYRTRDVGPLIRQTNCCEVTRFFHGIRLRDLQFAKQLGDAYRSYMKDLNGSAVLKRDRDTTNLFVSLLHWTAPDEGVPEKTTDDYLKLWALGNCFCEIFELSLDEKKALDQANEVAVSRGQSVKQDRRNFIFKVGNNYYLQRFYKTPIQEAPMYIELGNGREAAFEAFRANPEAFEEMQKWYQYAADSWNQYFKLRELQAAVGKYLDQLTKLPQRLLAERDVLQKFKQDPFEG